MRYLAIDYGAKRIGLALSDEEGKLAFPKCILENGPKILERVAEILEENSVRGIVLGESVNAEGKPNTIMKEIKIFSEKLEKKFSLPVHFQKEFFTTVEARRYGKEGERADAKAAALILQRYLDKINRKA